jgi:hypothetical protein
MEAKVNQYYQSLPSWAKGTVAVAVIAGIGILGFVIYKKIKLIQDKAVSNETANSAEDEYLKLKKKGQTLSFPQTNYFSAASAIQNALNGCDTYVGEEDAVYTVLNIVKKPIDWYYLVNIFGSRKIDDCVYGSTMYALPELLMQQLGNVNTSTSIYTKSNITVLRAGLKKIGVELG